MSCITSLSRQVLLLLTVLSVCVFKIPESGSAQIRLSQPIDLTGNWKLDSGESVTIMQTGNQVTAKFSPAVPCHKATRTNLFSAQLKTTQGGNGGATLDSNQFEACTREERLITDCGLPPLYVTKFEATVSPDGNTISGKRFAEGWGYDEKNGKYTNCHLDSQFDAWPKFTLTRECKADKAKQCAAIGKAINTIEKIIPPAVNVTPQDTGGLPMPTVSFDPAKWQQTFGQYKSVLAANLDDLGKQYCDEASKKSIDDMKSALDAIKPGSAQTKAAVRGEMLKISSIDFDLKVLAVQSCAVSGPATSPPPPPTSGICPEGSSKKKAGDDEAIDKIRSHINDSIKEATKMLEDYEREQAGGASTTAGQYADYWRTRLGQLKKLKGYWDNIRAASCVPPEIPNLIRAILSGRTDACINLCYATANWIEKMYPGPQGEYQKKLFLEACGFSCPD